MSKLVSIEGRTARGQVNESIVSLLEGWLTSAKQGEIKAISIIGLELDGTSRTSASQSECYHEMLGALAMMQFTMMVEHSKRG